MKSTLLAKLILVFCVFSQSFTLNASENSHNLSGLFKLQKLEGNSNAQFNAIYLKGDFTVYFSDDKVHYVGSSFGSTDLVDVNRMDLEFLNPSENVELVFNDVDAKSLNIKKSINGVIYRLIPAKSVTYKSIYSKIDLKYFLDDESNLTYNFNLRQGADASDIQIGLSKQFKTEIDADGNLKIEGQGGFFQESAPIVISSETSQQENLPTCNFSLTDNILSYQLGSFTESVAEYTIDPTISWNTYLGGSGSDLAGDMVVDDSGYVYVTGTTLSNNFPTQGATQTNRKALADAFISKFDSIGNLKWSTYYGGEKEDEGIYKELVNRMVKLSESLMA